MSSIIALILLTIQVKSKRGNIQSLNVTHLPFINEDLTGLDDPAMRKLSSKNVYVEET